MKNFVMFLTYSRVFTGPIIFIVSVYFEMYFIAFVLFVISALTDFLDGFLARRFGVDTALGALMDPVADKIILCSSLLSIVILLDDPFIAIISIIILSREFWVSSLREFTAINQLNKATNVTFLAKIKTSTQFLSISIFFFSLSYSLSLGIFIGSFVLFLSMLISIKTGIEYTNKTFNFYK